MIKKIHFINQVIYFSKNFKIFDKLLLELFDVINKMLYLIYNRRKACSPTLKSIN